MNEKIIRKAQIYLRNAGSKITVNGKFTIGMTTAVSAFQRKHDLTVTGELDALTWRALKRENSLWKRIKRKLKSRS